MAQRYDKPRKLNMVSFLLLLMAGAAVYCVVQFGPPYYRKWKAQGVLTDAANKVYPKRMVTESEQFIGQVREETERELRSLGIKDPALRITVEKSMKQVGVGAEYVEIIHHPVVNKQTTMTFRPHATVEATIE
jgi:hypothetical protein